MGITLRSLPRTGGATLMANPALRAFDVTVDKTVPLARLVTEFTGCQSPK